MVPFVFRWRGSRNRNESGSGWEDSHLVIGRVVYDIDDADEARAAESMQRWNEADEVGGLKAVLAGSVEY